MGRKSLGSALVVGVDGARGGWVAVYARAGVVVRLDFFADFSGVMANSRACAVIGVDMPVGLLNGWRECDAAARALLGPRASTVFPTPPRAVIEASNYDEARSLSRRLTGKAPSKQAFHLAPKILDVDEYAGDARIYEVHPELAFRAMAGAPLPSKKSYAGVAQRLRALEVHGLRLPDDPGPFAARLPPDDILDAAAVAWTAQRIAAGRATSVPPRPSQRVGRRKVAIWY